MDILIKVNVKTNKYLIQDTQEVNDTMKRTKLRIIGIEVEEETMFKYSEISKKKSKDNFLT